MATSRWVRLVLSRYPGRVIDDELTIDVCPFCGNRGEQHGNFQIQTTTGKFHCWNCRVGGSDLKWLLKRLGFGDVDGVPSRPVMGEYPAPRRGTSLALPDGCRPILSSVTEVGALAKEYLAHRGISDEEIVRFGLGYCPRGSYGGRIIIPFYRDADLIYFTARSFMGLLIPYLNPPSSLAPKPTVWYEGSDEIVIVEGPFDGIAVNRTGRTVCMLLGQELKVELPREGRKVIFLDLDANKRALRLYCDLSAAGHEAKIAQAEDDPGAMLVKEINQAIDEAAAPKFSDVMRLMCGLVPTS